ncbi:MAG: Ig domain-containing protein [Actinomycetota bacterium]|nr:Ig domain-containing protein [Actinomycetota bacterium]
MLSNRYRRSRPSTLIGLLAGLSVMLLAGNATRAAAATPGPVWPAATELPLAADVNPTLASQLNQLYSVACTSAGNCVGVGIYSDVSNNRRAMVVSETSGTWGRPSKVTLPNDAAASSQSAPLQSVSCASPGNCVAGGDYQNTSASTTAMIVTETDGTWGQASALILPADAKNFESEVKSVACTSPGNCIAGGDYTSMTNDLVAMYATETNGVWGQAAKLTLPGDAVANGSGNQVSALNSVTCTTAGNCVGSGYYRGSTGRQAMLATETGGLWGPATEVVLPTGAKTSSQSAILNSVTCPSQGSCVAVGNYSESVSNATQAMRVTETSGVWGPASELTLPLDAAAAANQNAILRSVTCTAPGYCHAAGQYYDTNGSPDAQAMLATETGGVWDHAAKVVLPAGARTAAASQNAYLDGVTCTSPGSCAAVGGYVDTAGTSQAMTLTSVPTLALTTTTLPSAVAGVQYSAQLGATGGAAKYTWSMGSGALPAGLSLDTATGVISGTPTATASGASSFTVALSDSGPPIQHASAALSISVSVPPPASASFGKFTSKGPKVMITVTCAGTALQKCTGTLLLTTLEHLTGHKVTAVSARKKVARKKVKKHTRTVTVGKGSYSVTGGRGFTVTMALNGTGKALLAKFHKLLANVALTPTGAKRATWSKTMTMTSPKPKRGRGR